MRVHLGFAVESVGISLGTSTVRAELAATRRIVTWSAGRGGLLQVLARTAHSARYVARLRIRR